MQPLRILETCLYADDLPAAERFYGELLGLEVAAHEPQRHVFFRCGPSMVLIFRPGVTLEVKSRVNGVDVPLHGARGPGHVAFAVAAAELSAWRERLTSWQVDIESEIDWPNGARSIYFRDPAGNSVELATPSLWGLGD